MPTKLAILLMASAAFVNPAHAFELVSKDVASGGMLKMDQVANVFGCKGGNISPELSWRDAPQGTKSYAVTMYDPDAPTGSGWWHWVAFDIPAGVTELKAGGPLPQGAVSGKADAGNNAYTGACPPPGSAHRYVITVKALKVEKLGLDGNASAALVGFMTNANKLGEASITATYRQ